MKRLNNYIYEWKANTNTMSSIEKHDIQYFVYNIKIKNLIKIFNSNWTQFKFYKDKVYINGEHVKLNDYGRTTDLYNPGTYMVEIKDIDEIINCDYMFYECDQLVSVPLFDTSKVKYMKGMFFNCIKLEKVPLFDTSNVITMYGMFHECEKLKNVPKFNIDNVNDLNFIFYKCPNLNRITINNWSSVYDFETHKQKI